jgi:predicted RecB family nuclease
MKNMILPSSFHFSQNNLQDYVDCPRRFELRYIQKLRWPALATEPVLEQERRMEMGKQFHLLVQQDILGISRPVLTEQAENQGLETWWSHYLDRDPLASLPPKRMAEYLLSAPLAGFRLLAQYDLIAVDPGNAAVIVDWKTSQRKTQRSILQKRLQTRIYPFLLVESGAYLFENQKILPEQIKMIYWFTEFPGEPEVFNYDSKRYAEDRSYLTSLVSEISSRSAGQFGLTSDERKCNYCVYRSLCERGGRAGNIQDSEEDEDLSPVSGINLDFEQIGEAGL